jgi:dTDP-4-dehydrorhamnose reductase
MVVLVTGALGQLGQAIQFIAPNHLNINFVFCNSSDLDITNKENCTAIFQTIQPDYCINAAAYTAVDKAESEPNKAQLINVVGAKNIAEACQEFDTKLIHISTDFVFDGTKKSPYNEMDLSNPKGVYGQTKLDGEKAIQEVLSNYYIIRTSWVYSQFGNNFMKTMLRLASERDTISVVNDQMGTPTHAIDLAEALVQIMITDNRQPTIDRSGIYHFSNEGQCTWYDFAAEIFRVNALSINLQPIPTSSYPTPAERPKYSVLDKTKIKSALGVEVNDWKKSLKKMKL